MIPVLGLIGAIGAGKSTVARAFARRGGYPVDCDRLGHVAIAQPEVLAKLVERWGERILLADRTPNRKAIGGIVFAEVQERIFLERVAFPVIGELARQEIAAANGNPAMRFVVLDAATLLEANWGAFCDRIVYVDAAEELRRKRVFNRSGWNVAELARREEAQWSAEVKKARADAVIPNEGSEDDLRMVVDRLLQEWGWIDEKECTDD